MRLEFKVGVAMLWFVVSACGGDDAPSSTDSGADAATMDAPMPVDAGVDAGPDDAGIDAADDDAGIDASANDAGVDAFVEIDAGPECTADLDCTATMSATTRCVAGACVECDLDGDTVLGANPAGCADGIAPDDLDCNDDDDAVYPGAPLSCADGVVNDCRNEAWIDRVGTSLGVTDFAIESDREMAAPTARVLELSVAGLYKRGSAPEAQGLVAYTANTATSESEYASFVVGSPAAPSVRSVLTLVAAAGASSVDSVDVRATAEPPMTSGSHGEVVLAAFGENGAGQVSAYRVRLAQGMTGPQAVAMTANVLPGVDTTGAARPRRRGALSGGFAAGEAYLPAFFWRRDASGETTWVGATRPHTGIDDTYTGATFASSSAPTSTESPLRGSAGALFLGEYDTITGTGLYLADGVSPPAALVASMTSTSPPLTRVGRGGIAFVAQTSARGRYVVGYVADAAGDRRVQALYGDCTRATSGQRGCTEPMGFNVAGTIDIDDTSSLLAADNFGGDAALVATSPTEAASSGAKSVRLHVLSPTGTAVLDAEGNPAVLDVPFPGLADAATIDDLAIGAVRLDDSGIREATVLIALAARPVSGSDASTVRVAGVRVCR